MNKHRFCVNRMYLQQYLVDLNDKILMSDCFNGLSTDLIVKQRMTGIPKDIPRHIYDKCR